MKKNILKSLLALAVIASAASCETYDYNENKLPGYDKDPEITDIQSLELTLTADDYKAISNNSANKAKAEAAGLDNELKAVGTNGCFSDEISGFDYIPNYLNSLYGSYLSTGSRANVTFNTAAETPEMLTAIMGSEAYKVTEEDYATVWGDEISAAYFTPAVSADSNVAAILATAFPEAADGDHVAVSYQTASQEPSINGNGGGSTEEEDKEEETDKPGTTTPSSITLDYEALGLEKGAQDLAGTITVEGIDFEYAGLSTDTGFGTIYVDYEAKGFIKSTSAISGLTEIIVTGNGFVKTNLFVSAGATADVLTEIISESEAGSGWGSTYSYVIPADAKFIAFSTPEGAEHDAGISSIELKLNGTTTPSEPDEPDAPSFNNFTLDYAALDLEKGAQDLAGTIAIEGIDFEYAGLSTDSGFGTIYVDYEAKGFIKSTSAFAGLTEIIVTGNGFVKTNLFVSAGATADALTEVISESEAGSGWGSTYSYVIPADAKFIAFSTPEGAEHDAGVTNIQFIFDAPSAVAAKAAAKVVTTERKDIYKFNGTAWSKVENTIVLTGADCKTIGSSYTNLSGSQPQDLVPTFLKVTYPYAAEGASINVAYDYYAGSNSFKASQYDMIGGEWVMFNNTEVVEAAPFEMTNAGWVYNPSMTITILPVPNDPNGVLYMQTIVDMIRAEYGDESTYVHSKLNGEYYSGCSSYYNNLSWRYDYIETAWTGADIDFTPYSVAGGADNINAMYDKLEENLKEMYSKALAKLHPNVAPNGDMEILFTIQYFTFVGKYDVDTVSHEMIFKVVGPGEFEFVELNVLDTAYDYRSDESIKSVIDTYK